MPADTPNGGDFGGPLFIPGMWRSGSSLLYALLNKHPQVGLMYEADLVLLRPAFWNRRKPDWAERWEFWNGAVRRHGFDPAEITDRSSNFRDAFVEVHGKYAATKGARIWGDKSPDLHNRLARLAR